MPVDHAQLYALGSERDALVLNLDEQREGLVSKLDGLDDAQARLAPTVSTLSLLGLVKHAATWEARWFQVVVAGESLPDGWPEVRPEPRDADLFVDEHDTIDHWVRRYQEQCERSREIVAARELDDLCARTDVIECNLRYVLHHMIRETARHAGHADLVRETLDGSTAW